jgi:hypothetical protein
MLIHSKGHQYADDKGQHRVMKMNEIIQRAQAFMAQVTAKDRLRLPNTIARRIQGPQCQLDYQPLTNSTSIRLLKIHPLASKSGISEDTIQCCMEVVDLAKRPIYDALSYTWGDPKTLYYGPQEPRGKDWVNWSHTILCNGKPVSVSTNLYTAMLALRCRKTRKSIDNHTLYQPAESIWIDALCINQRDDDERARQVGIMDKIYDQAQSVPIWLGNEDAATTRALTAMAALDCLIGHPEEWLKTYTLQLPETYSTLDIPPINVSQWIDLFAFLNRSWFKRAWIVQEVTLSKNPVFLCGAVTLDFDMIFHRVNVLSKSGWMSQMIGISTAMIRERTACLQRGEDIPNAKQQVSVYSPTGEVHYDRGFMRSVAHFRAERGIGRSPLGVAVPFYSASLMDVLEKHRSAAATDPRDKIYAFLSLAWDFAPGSSRRHLFKPDYNTSVREVYVEATKFMIESEGGLDILSLKEDEIDREGSDLTLPSWVPDFSVDRPAPLNSQPRMWTASGGRLEYACPRYHEGDVMEVQGVQVGTIGKVSQRYLDSGPDEPLVTGLLDLYSSMVKSLRVYPPELDDRLLLGPWRVNSLKTDRDVEEQDRQEVVWRTLLLDRNTFWEHPIRENCAAEAVAGFERKYDEAFGVAKISLLGHMVKQLGGETPEHEIDDDWKQARQTFDPSKDYKRAQIRYALWKMFCGQNPIGELFDLPGIGKLPSLDTPPNQEWIDRVTKARVKDPRDPIDRKVQEMSGLLFVKQSNRQLFTTSDGRLGIAPHAARAGDQIWVIGGASLPLIVRAGKAGRSCKLIGDAYVHGWMQGQALREGGSPRALRLA